MAHGQAATQQVSGLTITPALLKLNVDDDKAPKTINVRNNTSVTSAFSASLRSVKVARSGVLVPADSLDTNLQQAVSVSVPSFQLEPKQSIDLEIQLTDKARIPPGGTYVALLITQTGNDGSSQLGVLPAVSALVFLSKQSGAKPGLSVKGISSDGGLLRSTSTVTAEFSNTGNVPVTPRAVVTVLDPRGREVKRGVLNEQSITILPTNNVRIQTNLFSVARLWLPGRYSVQLAYRYDGSDEQRVYERKYVMFPPVALMIISVGIVGVVLLVIAVRRLFRNIVRRHLSRPVTTSDGNRHVPTSPKKIIDVVAPVRKQSKSK